MLRFIWGRTEVGERDARRRAEMRAGGGGGGVGESGGGRKGSVVTRVLRPGPGSMKGLEWLARAGPSPLDPWRYAMGWSEVAARHHARRLEREGWLERCPTVRGQGSLFLATRKGVLVLGLPLIAATTPARTWWAHDSGCAWTAAWLHDAHCDRPGVAAASRRNQQCRELAETVVGVLLIRGSGCLGHGRLGCSKAHAVNARARHARRDARPARRGARGGQARDRRRSAGCEVASPRTPRPKGAGGRRLLERRRGDVDRVGGPLGARRRGPRRRWGPVRAARWMRPGSTV